MFIYLSAALAATLALIVAFCFPLPPRDGRSGRFVAEVWLEWEICRGSTMYRQCFRTRYGAWLAAKLAAMRLDFLLPRTYYAEGWNGNLIRFKHEYGIAFGVRQKTAQEREADGFKPLLSIVLPGSSRFSGEHSDAHPLLAAGATIKGPNGETLLI